MLSFFDKIFKKHNYCICDSACFTFSLLYEYVQAPNNEGVEDLSYQTMHNPKLGGYKPTLFIFGEYYIPISFIFIIISVNKHCFVN